MAKCKATLPLYYECDQCGACCEGLIVEAQLSDGLREPRIVEKCKLMDGHGKLPILDAAYSIACGATQPCPFASRDNGKHRCGIYPTRPEVCVSFMAGGVKCRELRAERKLPPLVGRAAVTTNERVMAVAVEAENEDA